MKRLLLSLSLLATLFLMASCSGFGGGSGLAGEWGLVLFEWEEYLDGVRVDGASITLDPADPNTDDDMKLEISHVDGNEYRFVSYEWSPKQGDWKQLANFIVTVNGNKMVVDDEEVTFKVSGNTLTITAEESEVDEDGTWTWRDKNVYKRLSAPAAETPAQMPSMF
ncbi:MAG: hypothetical protein J5639_05370 [Bacteroidales bacterium]|nr:hypothetical protein [Bacteroidales bacterium]